MISEHRADELKRKSKDELITLLLEAEQSYQDVIAGLEAACEEAISRIESLSEWMQCECSACSECGKTPKECTDTPCAETCTCSECDRCQADGTLTFIRAALVKAGVDRA